MAGIRFVVDRDRRMPRTAADLNVAEQFVLWALRIRLEGRSGHAQLEQGFRLARDDAAGGARAAFEPWFAILAANCRRDLHLHRARCPCLSGDELVMLDLVASAQTGDGARLHRVAATVVHPHAIELLQATSRTFAIALCQLGLHLPRRRVHAGRAGSTLLH